MLNITWDRLSQNTLSLAEQIISSGHEYDLCIGLLRGGCVPATIISHYLGIPMIAIGIQTYDDQHRTGVVNVYQSAVGDIYNLRLKRSITRVLVVDDLADTGDTFEYIKSAYKGYFDVDTAALYIKEHTKHRPNYYLEQFSNDQWVVFPWEHQATQV